MPESKTATVTSSFRPAVETWSAPMAARATGVCGAELPILPGAPLSCPFFLPLPLPLLGLLSGGVSSSVPGLLFFFLLARITASRVT